MKNISPALVLEARASTDCIILDVRKNWERDICTIKDTHHIPLGELSHRFQELDQAKTIYVLCHHGGRSAHAVLFLENQGFDALNIEGGIDLWARQLDPSMPRY